MSSPRVQVLTEHLLSRLLLPLYVFPLAPLEGPPAAAAAERQVSPDSGRRGGPFILTTGRNLFTTFLCYTNRCKRWRFYLKQFPVYVLAASSTSGDCSSLHIACNSPTDSLQTQPDHPPPPSLSHSLGSARWCRCSCCHKCSSSSRTSRWCVCWRAPSSPPTSTCSGSHRRYV